MERPDIKPIVIDRIFRILEEMDVQLEENPLEYGPALLNRKIAQARTMRSSTEALYNKVSQWLRKYKAAHRAAEVGLQLGKKHLLANDPEVRAGRNVADREALASIKMRNEVEELSQIASSIDDLVSILAVVKAKRADLNDIQGRIRDQIRLCQEEIALGGHWGSRRPPGSAKVDIQHGPSVDRTTLTELQKMFAGITGVDEESLTEALTPKEVAEAEPEPAPREDQEEIDSIDMINQILDDFPSLESTNSKREEILTMGDSTSSDQKITEVQETRPDDEVDPGLIDSLLDKVEKGVAEAPEEDASRQAEAPILDGGSGALSDRDADEVLQSLDDATNTQSAKPNIDTLLASFGFEI